MNRRNHRSVDGRGCPVFGLGPLLALASTAILTVLALLLIPALPGWTQPKLPWTHTPELASNFTWDGHRPLKVAFLGAGTRGDIQQHIALALELFRLGHIPTIIGFEQHRGLIEKHPSLRFTPYQDAYIWSAAAELEATDASVPVVAARYVEDSARQLTEQFIKAASDSDVLVGTYTPFTSIQHLTVAQALQKPLFFTAPDVTYAMPNIAYSYDLMSHRIHEEGERHLTQLANLLHSRCTGLFLGAYCTLSPWSPVRKLRRSLGLHTPFPIMEALSPSTLSSIPTFFTWDLKLWPKPSNFSPHWHPTGYLAARDGSMAQTGEDKDLQVWMDERRTPPGPERPLVYLALAPAGLHNRTMMTEILLDALDKLGMDALTLRSTWDGRPAPEHVFVAEDSDNINLDPVLLQTAAVIHQGSPSPAAMAIRSGRPSVCIPSTRHKEVWATAIEDMNAGVLVSLEELFGAWSPDQQGAPRTNTLAAAISSALRGDRVKAARHLGREAREAGGVALAGRTIIRYLQELRLRAEGGSGGIEL